MLLIRSLALMFLAAVAVALAVPNAVAQEPFWCDGFQTYTVGSAPFPPWLDGMGNTSGITVDNSVSSEGAASLKMFGQIGSCWAATMARPYAGFPLYVSMKVRNGSEALSGCNPFRAGLDLRTGGPEWWNCPCPGIFYFLANGDLVIPIPPESPTTLTGYPLEAWLDLKCFLWLAGDAKLHVKIWIDGASIGEFTLPEAPWMAGSNYIDLNSREGSAWFDEVCVSSFTVQTYPPCPQVSTCGLEATDVDTSGATDVLDVTHVINRAFRGAAELFPKRCVQQPVP